MSAAQTTRRNSTRRDPRVLLRLPVTLLQQIDAAAKSNYRTRTAEILLALETYAANGSIDEHGVIVQRTPGSRK